MSSLIDKINTLRLGRRNEILLQGLDEACDLILSEIGQNHRSLFKDDFGLFRSKGRYVVNNTFAGGIIFLREPEVIEGITIDFTSKTNNALAVVEYGSELRNQRNVKYKPEAGKIESIEWSMASLIPNFYTYDREIKIAFMALIGNFVKVICEDLNQNSWFMKYERDFYLEMLLDNELIIRLPIIAS